MIITEPSFEILAVMQPDIELIETAGRVCYKSKKKNQEAAQAFVRKLIASGHESVIEHSALTIKFIFDRGISHELVRHRLAAYSQESTRYCNYAKDNEIEVVKPFFFDVHEPLQPVELPNRHCPEHSYVQMNSFDVWFTTCRWAEWGYMTLVKQFGRTPQEARTVLPNSLKTEIVVTANFREWRHILKLRTKSDAHPQMREIMLSLLKYLKQKIPVIFDDIDIETEKESVSAR